MAKDEGGGSGMNFFTEFRASSVLRFSLTMSRNVQYVANEIESSTISCKLERSRNPSSKSPPLLCAGELVRIDFRLSFKRSSRYNKSANFIAKLCPRNLLSTISDSRLLECSPSTRESRDFGKIQIEPSQANEQVRCSPHRKILYC